MGLFGRKRIVGVDIGSAGLKVVEAAPTGTGIRVLGTASAPTPAGAVRDGRIADPASVGAALREVLRRGGVSGRRAVSGVSGQAAIVRELRLPAMKPDELREAARFEAERYIPYGAQDASLDVQVLGEVAQEGGTQLEVLLVATRNEVVQGHIAALEAAGLTPLVLDVEPFALVRALGNGSERATAFAHIGAASTDIVITEGGRLQLTRNIPAGVGTFVHAVAHALDLSPEAAQQALRDGAAEATTRAVIDQAVGPTLGDVITEVHRSLDYFRSRSRPAAIEKIVLSGGGATLFGIDRQFAAELGLAVEVGNPFANGHVDAGGLDDGPAPADGPAYAVAVGLALRGADEG